MKEPLLYKFVRPLIKLFVRIVFHPTIIGKEYIPKNGKIILSGNHTNNLDCILIMSCTKRPIHFLAKDSLLKGLKKIIFKNMGIIPVNRNIHDKSALNNAINCLKEDKVIGIFPEGTINRTDKTIMPFKYGCVKMSIETNTNIVPFIITGQYKIFKNNLEIEFLKPIESINDIEKYNEHLMKVVSDSLEEKRK